LVGNRKISNIFIWMFLRNVGEKVERHRHVEIGGSTWFYEKIKKKKKTLVKVCGHSGNTLLDGIRNEDIHDICEIRDLIDGSDSKDEHGRSTNDSRLAKIAKNGKPNSWKRPPKCWCKSWTLTSQENRYTRRSNAPIRRRRGRSNRLRLRRGEGEGDERKERFIVGGTRYREHLSTLISILSGS